MITPRLLGPDKTPPLLGTRETPAGRTGSSPANLFMASENSIAAVCATMTCRYA